MIFLSFIFSTQTEKNVSLMVFSFHTCTCDTLALAAAKKWQDPDRRGGGQASKRAKTDVASESLASPASGSSPALTGTGWMSLAGVRAPSNALARLQLEGSSVLGEDREEDAATEVLGGAATARGALRREEAKKKKQNSHKWGPCMICLKTPSDLEVL